MTTGTAMQPDGAALPGTGSPPVASSGATFARYATNAEREHGFEPLRIEGRIPEGLRGTMYRNGPGLLTTFSQPYEHSFEGDGAVSAVRLDGLEQRATGAYHVVESEGLRFERDAGRPMFSSRAPWRTRMGNALRRRFKNNANTSILVWRDRLFALADGARPTELDAGMLTTVGETDLDGLIAQTFSAHPHDVVARSSIYNFGVRFGRKTQIDLFELPYKHRPARRLGQVELAHPVMLHDFVATERHLVFLVSPVRLVLWRAALMLTPVSKLVRWSEQDGTEVIVVPIDAPRSVTRFRVDPFFQWHFAGGFERGGEIAVDLVRYPRLNSLHQTGERAARCGTYHRAIIDLARRSLTSTEVIPVGCEFPQIDPRRSGSAFRYAWCVADGAAGDSITRIDTETGETVVYNLAASERASEPLFWPRAPDSGESDGWVLSLIYDASTHTSHVAVFDANGLQDGPVARVHFDHHVPPTYHGKWVPSPA
ncbi:carotenoid oxygenase family protein [Sorangium sp. So ce429]